MTRLPGAGVTSGGTPNFFWQGKNCGEAEFIAESAIYGYITTLFNPVPGVTKCLMVWGHNPWASFQNMWPQYLEAKKRGAKMVVVDPRLTDTAEEADIWLQLRPGTDGALPYGMLNVIINEGLYDKEFVQKQCLGFDKVKKLVQKYSPDKVEGITWVPREKTVEVARLFAISKPAYLTFGAATCHLGGRAVMPAVVAKCILRAITGNLNVMGGSSFTDYPFPHIWTRCTGTGR